QDRDVQEPAARARRRGGAVRAAARADRARHRRRDAGRDRRRHRRRADPGARGATPAQMSAGATGVAAVVLAAGASTRMGEPKALLRIGDGSSYVEAIAATARAGGCDEIVVVLGPPHGDTIRAQLASAPPSPSATIAWNPDPSRGMLSSVHA